MDTFNDSRFDEFNRELASIRITIDPFHGCSISGCTTIHYVDYYDGIEKDEVYEYRYHFTSEEFKALTDRLKIDFSSWFLDAVSSNDPLINTVADIIKKRFDFSARMPGTLHEYADSKQLHHTFEILPS